MSKYALCIRGISYLKDFIHDGSTPPFTIDFDHVLPDLQKNIINPLIEKGDTVDSFINTYKSSKLDSYIDNLKPVCCEINDYYFIQPGKGHTVYNKIIKCLEMVLEYEQRNNIKYDYIIVTRFDILIFEKITNIYIPSNAISSITPRDDNFFILSRDILETVLNTFLTMRSHNMLTHDYTSLMTQRGIRCHTIYSHVYIQKHYPFSRTSRHIFVDHGHPHKHCDYDELFKDGRPGYGFFYLPNTEYTPYVDPNITVRDPKNHKPEYNT